METNLEKAESYVRKKYHQPQRVAEVLLKNMASHEDILAEFVNYIETGKMEGPDGGKIVVCGYTAESLFQEFPTFSPLGVYNFLVSLREKPKQALAQIRVPNPKK